MRKTHLLRMAPALLLVALTMAWLIPYAFSATGLEQYATPTVVNATGTVTLNGTWTGEDQSVLFCQDSSCTDCWYNSTSGENVTTGCWCYNLTPQTGSYECTYTTQASDSWSNSFYLEIYNSSQTNNDGVIHTAATPDSYFLVNHAPNATNVSISPEYPFYNSTLSCTYDFTDPDGNAEAGTSPAYRWMLWNGSSYEVLSGETSANLTADVNVSDLVMCAVNVTDEYGLSGGYVSSAAVNISEYIAITALTDDSNSTNPTLTWSNVTFNLSWTSSNSTLYAIAYVCNDSGINASGCGSGAFNYCNSSYSNSSPLTCSYNVTASDPTDHTYYVRACYNNSGCSESIWSGTFYRYNDTGSPSFNLTTIPNYTTTMPYSLSFYVLDSFELNITTLLLNISNSTGVIHAYNYSNLTCTGNETEQLCNITLNLTDGSYNLTFYVEDTNTNSNVTVQEFGVDMLQGYILKADFGNNYSSPMDTTNTKLLYLNWTPASGLESGVERYEYAVGLDVAYNTTGWNSILDWTDAGTNVAVVANLTSIVHEQVYRFHVRALSNAGSYTNATTSNAQLYLDTSRPYCTDCIIDDGSWTNSKTQLHFIMNFSEAGSPIVGYNYSLGNNTCLQTGYDSLVSNQYSETAEIFVSGLTLQDNVTYYLCARALASNGEWSYWGDYSNGLRVDSMSPVGGFISYTDVNLSTNTTVISLDEGSDNYSGIASRVLQFAQVAYNPTEGCGGYSGWADYNASIIPGTSSLTVSLSHGYCYKFRYRVTDSAGNSQLYYYGAGVDFFVDTTPPENFTVSMNNGGFYTYSNDFILNWSGATDPESGIGYYSYTVKDNYGGVVIDWENTTFDFILLNDMAYPGGSPLLHEYKYYAEVVAYNNLGTPFNTSSNQVLFLDNVPPAPVTIVNVAGDSNASDGYYDFTDDGQTNVTVEGENGMECVYSVYDIDYSTTYGTNCTGTVGNTSICEMSLSDGNYTYYITCRDANGNPQQASQNTAVNFVVDLGGPAISSVAPANNSIVAGQVTISASVADAGIGTVSAVWYEIRNLSGTLSASGNLTNTAGSTYASTWDSASADQTTYNLTIFANDSLGQESQSSVQFTLNRDLPYLEVTHDDYAPAPTTGFNITILAQVFTNVSYNITNSSGSQVAFDSNTTDDTANRNYLSWLVELNISNTSTWQDGEYNLSVMTVNNASNVSQSNSTFMVDRYAPAYANVLNTSNLTVYNNGSVNLTVDWTDANNISEVRFETNALSGSLENYTALVVHIGDTYSLLLDAVNLENNETVYWRSYAADAAGHWNETVQDNFTVSNRDPVINTSAPAVLNASKNVLYSLDIDRVLLDYDLDNLTYNATGSSNITIVSVSQQTGIAVLNFTTNWTGEENVTLNVTDPFSATNGTVVTINVSNDAPNLTSQISSIAWLYNTNYTSLDLTSYFTDVNGDEVNYTANSSDNITVVINQTTGEVILVPDSSWSGLGWVIFNATDVENESTLSNNVTLSVYTSTENSTVQNTTVNGVFYTLNITNQVPGIANSTVNASNITNSIIINSTVFNCTISDTTVENANLSDCYIDPSNVINSTVAENSSVYDSNITDSFLYNATVNLSTILNSTLYDTVVHEANISNGVIYWGTILVFNGSTYNATLSGAENLTVLVNFPPVASIAGTTIAYAGSESSFTTNSTDPNVNSSGGSAINDSLTYYWDFGDGNTATTTSTSATNTYTSAGDYTVTLTASDQYGRNSTVSTDVTVSTSGGGGGSSGGSGGGSSIDYEEPSRTIELDLSSGEESFELFTAANKPNVAAFSVDSVYYQLTLKAVNSNSTSIHIDSDPELSKQLYVGESQGFDVDHDGAVDIYVSLDDVNAWTSGEFTLLLAGGAPVAPPVTGEAVTEPTQPSVTPTPEQPAQVEPEEYPIAEGVPGHKTLLWSLIGLVLIAGLVALYAKRDALKRILAQQSSIPAESPGSNLSSLMKEDEVDKFITDELYKGRSFTEILDDMEKSGWVHRAAYYKIARYVAREGIKEGKSFNIVYDEMLGHGWDQDIVTSILNESIVDERPR